MGYESPTGHIDPETAWTDPTYAYDEATGQAAYSGQGTAYTEWLELTPDAPFNSSGFRYFVRSYMKKIKVDWHYDAGWHNVYEELDTTGDDTAWWEVTGLTPHIIDKMRVAVGGRNGSSWRSIYEFDFWEHEVTLHELTVTDGLQLSDTLIKTPMKMISDGIALSDVLIKNPIKTLTDAIALSDVLEKVYIYVRTFTDSIAFTDTLIKSTAKVLSDGIAFTDTLVKQTAKVLSDGIAFTDALIKTPIKVFTDGIAFTDVLRRDIIKVFTDAIAFTDILKKLWVHGVLRILTAVRNLLSIREEGTKR